MFKYSDWTIISMAFGAVAFRGFEVRWVIGEEFDAFVSLVEAL